jgi:hypothetical protein
MPTTPPLSGQIRQGWISLAFWMSFGLLVEGLIGFRMPALLDDPVRREMFRLAHAHGTVFNVVLIVATICARVELVTFTRLSSLALRLGVLLLPGGFLLGGIWHFKNDPGFGVWLVPCGALLMIFSVILLTLSARGGRA